MATAQFFQTPDSIGAACQENGFSQSVSIPASARLVITAGQAGFNLKTGELVVSSVADQIEAAFDCVDAALKAAGVEDGLASAHKMTTYMMDARDEPTMMAIWRRRYPNRRPTWTCIGISNLCLHGMVVEIQGEAIIR